MNDETKVLSRKAQALSPNDRVALIEEVLDSLDRADPAIESYGQKRPRTALPLTVAVNCRRGI